MLTLVEGATPTFEEECGCGGTNCDGSGFPDYVEAAVYRHEESGSYWVLLHAVRSAEERVADAINPMMLMMAGKTVEDFIEENSIGPVAIGKAYVCSPEGIIPNFAPYPILGDDLEDGSAEDILALLHQNVDRFHALKDGMLSEDDMARLTSGETATD